MTNALTPKKNSTASGILSFIVPGLGQLYNGHIARGVFWLIVGSLAWFSTGILGWVVHIAAAYTAYRRAEDMNSGKFVPQIPSRLGE